MADQVLESLRVLICALNLALLFVFPATTYVPFICRPWGYKKGIIIQRDYCISTVVLVASTVRVAGILLAILGCFRDRSNRRHTLYLRIMLAMTTGPIDVRVTGWAFKTCKWARRTQGGQETGPQQPFPYTGPIPRSHQVLATVNPDRESRNVVDDDWSDCCWYTWYCGAPFFILILAAVHAGLSMSKSPRRDRDWAAVLIWLLPPAVVILDQAWFYSPRRRRHPAIVETGPGRVTPHTAVPGVWHLGGWNSWIVGTMLGAVVFLIVFVMDWEWRKGTVSYMFEFWYQLAEALTGCGG